MNKIYSEFFNHVVRVSNIIQANALDQTDLILQSTTQAKNFKTRNKPLAKGDVFVYDRFLLFWNTLMTNLPPAITSPDGSPKVGIIMGSQSDWETMQHAAQVLKDFGVPFECEVVSAHRTPDKLFDYAKSAKSRGLSIIIAGAGGAAHLPGMCASQTDLPVLGVPVKSSTLSGWDSLLSIVQMPKGVAVGTLAIGTAGAFNAGLLAVQILAINDTVLSQKVSEFRANQTQSILDNPTPGVMN